MLIAERIKKQSVAAYVLTLWQTEDAIRALGLDIDSVCAKLIDPTGVTGEERLQAKEWYESLIMMMRMENAVKGGHLQISKNAVIRLDDLHRELLASDSHPDYCDKYYSVLPLIVELRAKSGGAPAGEVETCLNALYGVLTLKMRGSEVSQATLQAAERISGFLELLSRYYKQSETGQAAEPID